AGRCEQSSRIQNRPDTAISADGGACDARTGMKIRSEQINNRRFLANQVVDKQRETSFADPENYDLVAAFFISAVLNFEYLPQTQQGNSFTPQMEQLTSFETVELGGTNARGFHHGAQRESIDLVCYLHEQNGKNG